TAWSARERTRAVFRFRQAAPSRDHHRLVLLSPSRRLLGKVAAGHVAFADLIERRMLRSAAIPRVRTTVVKAAALRPFRGGLPRAGSRREPLALMSHLRHRGQ